VPLDSSSGLMLTPDAAPGADRTAGCTDREERCAKRFRRSAYSAASSGVGAPSVGDIVRVVDDVHLYDSYSTMAEQLRLSHWQSSIEEQIDGAYVEPLNGDVGIVLATGTHHDTGVPLFGVHIPQRGHDYLFQDLGLKVLARAQVNATSIPATIMREMWASRAASGDATLRAQGGCELPAHACVLAAASPVFEASFASGMREASTREITLPDTAPETVEAVLELLYLGSMPDAADRRCVLAFAHTYSIVEAARFVAPALVASMTLGDACETVRMLRDFDRLGTSFVKMVLDVWGDSRPIMAELLSRM